ncbi:MAG: signal peptidase I [Pyrinomonadaceae bacterium]|nr:signal peptidase I [Pyrinomonadaceae bacterium]
MFRRRKKFEPLAFIGADDDRDLEVYRPDRAARQHFRREAGLLLRDVVFAAAFAVLVIVFIIQPVKVEGSSMLPRLHDGERIFVNKLVYYGLPELERGDIVVFWFPDDPSKSYIKRVIGLPGETIEVRDGRILVNGREIVEPYLDSQRNVARVNEPPRRVKDHYYFVMGDNRDRSSDSRDWGLVPEKYIYGKALLRFWPLDVAGVIRHETDYNELPASSSPSADTDDNNNAPLTDDTGGLDR